MVQVRYQVDQADSMGRWITVGQYTDEEVARVTADEMVGMNGHPVRVERVEREEIYYADEAPDPTPTEEES